MTVNLFDLNFYRAANPDLAAAGLTTEAQLVSHFINFGANEGRRFSAFVNLDLYRTANPDLAAAGLNTGIAAFYHLQALGVAEGRRFSYGLNIPYYRGANPDLGAAGINTNEGAFQHFRSFGVNEGRASAENFNAQFYLNANPDLRALGFNFSQAFGHYVTYGIREGRPAVPGASSPTPPPQAEPGNSTNTAFNVSTLVGTRNFNEFVGFNDRNDFYRFNLQLPSDFILTVDGVTNRVDVSLYSDINGNGQIDSGEFVTSDYATGSGGTANISRRLSAGTYFVQVEPDSEGRNTNYTLELTANNTRDELIDGGLLNGARTFNESVGRNDRRDFYRFVLNRVSNFRLTLSGVTATTDVDLYVDTNGNGQIDSGEFITSDYATSSGRNANINRTLGADTYFVVVGSGIGGNTNYTLNLSAV